LYTAIDCTLTGVYPCR